MIRFKNGTIGIVEGTALVYPKNLEETLSNFGEQGTAVIGGLAVNRVETWNFAELSEEMTRWRLWLETIQKTYMGKR